MIKLIFILFFLNILIADNNTPNEKFKEKSNDSSLKTNIKEKRSLNPELKKAMEELRAEFNDQKKSLEIKYKKKKKLLNEQKKEELDILKSQFSERKKNLRKKYKLKRKK